MGKAIRFGKDEHGVRLMAAYLLELEKLGAAYDVKEMVGSWDIEITGY